jgi:hypothetical protein
MYMTKTLNITYENNHFKPMEKHVKDSLNTSYVNKFDITCDI